jgi:hypothetical protein
MNRPAVITNFPALTVSEFTPANYSPDCQLDLDAVRGAIHTVFAGELASEAEERGHSLPSGGGSLDAWAPIQPDSLVLPYAWYIIGRVQQAWGHPVGLVFHHAGIETASDQEHALADLFLGIQGHGVSLADDFAEAMEKSAAVLNRYDKAGQEFDLSPVDDEMNPIRDLARAVWDLVDGPTIHQTKGRGPICGATGITSEYVADVTCPTCQARGEG